MGFVYLISEYDNDKLYKIGVTNKNNVELRLKELQTGNSNELYVKDYYKTDKPFELENLLHRYYHKDNKLNEWFELSVDEANNFKNVCSKYDNIFKSLKDNPFFKAKKKEL